MTIMGLEESQSVFHTLCIDIADHFLTAFRHLYPSVGTHPLGVTLGYSGIALIKWEIIPWPRM